MENQNESMQENAGPAPEIYNGDEIHSIRFYGGSRNWPDSVNIRLKNGKYIEVNPHGTTGHSFRT